MFNQTKDLALLVFVSSTILIAIVVYFLYTFVREQRKIMKWQQARIAAEIETLENERKRIATDLHDEIGPVLSAVKLQINHLEPQEEVEKAILDKSSNQIDFIIQKFRDISYNLLPNTLVRKGLIKAIEEFIYRVKNDKNLIINFSFEEIPTISLDRQINIFRIVQEIVHNTIKHAKASNLNISITNKENLICVTTYDDGVGFQYNEKLKHANGIGLLNLQSRAEVLNSRLDIESTIGKGTNYSLEIPV